MKLCLKSPEEEGITCVVVGDGTTAVPLYVSQSAQVVSAFPPGPHNRLKLWHMSTVSNLLNNPRAKKPSKSDGVWGREAVPDGGEDGDAAVVTPPSSQAAAAAAAAPLQRLQLKTCSRGRKRAMMRVFIRQYCVQWYLLPTLACTNICRMTLPRKTLRQAPRASKGQATHRAPYWPAISSTRLYQGKFFPSTTRALSLQTPQWWRYW